MASGPYKPVMFSDGEPLDRDKLNQMANNDQWLYENTPRMSYVGHGLNKSNGVRIMAGLAHGSANPSQLTWAVVYFGSFFSQGCRPIVVATPISGATRTKFETVVRGIGTIFPDHRGCQIGITTDDPNPAANHHQFAPAVDWIAIGW